MAVPFKRWVAGVTLGMSLSAGAFGLAGTLRAAESTGSHEVVLTVDQQRDAAKLFSDRYGKDEKAALASHDSAEKIALAKTLFADSQQPNDNPAFAIVLRTHAAGLLFRSGEKAAYDLALALEKTALDSDKADPLTSASALAEMLGEGVKDIPPADRAPQYAKLVGLFQTVGALQIQAHRADEAVQALTRAANYANAANDRKANKDANDLMLVLRPMSANALTLSKALEGLEKTPDDKKLNTEAATLLLRDWGDVAAAGKLGDKGDAAQLKGLTEMAAYETAGRSAAGMDAVAVRKLADAYEGWAKDGRDSKLGKLVLTQRTAELFKALAGLTQGSEAANATKDAERLTAEATRYEQEAGGLLAVLQNGAAAGGTSSASNGADGSGGATASAGSAGPVSQKSQARVQAQIDKVGPTDPSWLAAAALSFPDTLDLTWAPPSGKGWNGNKVLGQYIWSVVNENPSQWKSGVKLMYKVLEVNKNDPAKLNQTHQALARMYYNYFKDYERAAYYYQKCGTPDHLDPQHCADNVDLAHCYFHLGNVDMARKLLEGYPTDNTVHGAVINAWGMFGDITQALKMADSLISGGRAFIGYSAGGDVCRRAGRWDEALKYYEGYLKSNGVAGANKARAQEAYDTIKFFTLFDLSKVPDGTFQDSATGYRGAVEAVVTVKGHKIVDVKVNHREDQCYSSITDVPARIIEKQTVKGIDATSGATVTSNAIVMAAAKALGNAAK